MGFMDFNAPFESRKKNTDKNSKNMFFFQCHSSSIFNLVGVLVVLNCLLAWDVLFGDIEYVKWCWSSFKKRMFNMFSSPEGRFGVLHINKHH